MTIHLLWEWLGGELLAYGPAEWAAFLAASFLVPYGLRWPGIFLAHLLVATGVVVSDLCWIQAEMRKPGWDGVPDQDIVFLIGVASRVVGINALLLPLALAGWGGASWPISGLKKGFLPLPAYNPSPMLRPFIRLRFRLTNAVWALALALALGGMTAFTPLHRIAFAEAGGTAASWVMGRAPFAVWSACAPAAAVNPPVFTASSVGLPASVLCAAAHAAPLPAALWPLPPPALA